MTAKENKHLTYDANQLFDKNYYATSCGPDVYERSRTWLNFYSTVVEHIIRSIAPKTVFDAGCALGMIVEAFWDRGIEATGADISEFAIANVRADMREHCFVASLADPIAGRYDLVTCIEVLEHMPSAEASRAIEHISQASDTVIFSSSPYDFQEKTHINVRPPIDWIKQFGQHGLWPDLIYDASFILPHTMLLRRGQRPSDAAISVYIEKLRLLHMLAESKRTLGAAERKLLSVEQHSSHQHNDYHNKSSLLQSDLDAMAAQLAMAQHAHAQAIERLHIVNQQLTAIEGSATWRATSSVRSLASQVPPPIRRFGRRAARLCWWAITPHRTPARIQYLRERKIALANSISAPGLGKSYAASISGPDHSSRSVAKSSLTTADVVNRSLSDLRPLPVFSIARAVRPRITMVTDSIAADSFFGGVGTATILAALWAKRRGATLRISTLRAEPLRDNVANLLVSLGVLPPEHIEFCYTNISKTGRPIDLSKDDVFLTTSWWSTANVLSAVPHERVVYILQEDERMFYPHGDEQLRAYNTMRTPGLRRVVNTKLLYDHLIDTGITGLREHATWFEPAFPDSAYFPDRVQRQKRNFFFYARPNNARNLYLLGLETLNAAVEQGILKPDEWNIHFVGRDLPVMAFPGGMPITIIESLPWDKYVTMLRSMDLGLSLMLTPHPSYPPLDLAACGAVAVTNSYGLKQSLATYSDNLICAEPTVDALLEALRSGVSLVQNGPDRSANYERQGLKRSWEQSLASTLDWLEEV
ncbi:MULTISPECIES: class I SAM-dependent methyltransferase [Methylobacterium]|uniref:Ubiquinone biosynthesis O-methyltransferase, mitochondrial n=1 Tax=Methylobacterium bullatum TaxID=570505 RepID=A0AAV4Z7X4_9HYPH|nr:MULTISPECIES: class I SAM-dependent methyltransferase [Methylobacterium]TXN25838.1 class I SAM-dependent methyltransferase [Methylobacterium sp. WL19]GJD39818.1 Ubiquinone biosynthesis O-methyltransferase, mitochondrial [Methylobacterium bullatum]